MYIKDGYVYMEKEVYNYIQKMVQVPLFQLLDFFSFSYVYCIL